MEEAIATRCVSESLGIRSGDFEAQPINKKLIDSTVKKLIIIRLMLCIIFFIIYVKIKECYTIYRGTMRIHAVHHLYQQRLALSTKPFMARGSKIERCLYCKVAKSDCLCSYQPNIESDIAVLLLLSDNEIFKPSNTGRLIADVIKDSYAFLWNRTQPDPKMLALLDDPLYVPVLVFPETYLDDPSRLCGDVMPLKKAHQRLLLIFIDASWREACKIFRRSNYLAHLPVISIKPQSLSRYLMRKSENKEHLSTAEVASLVLAQAGEIEASQVLYHWFEAFRETYLLSRTRLKPDFTRPCLSQYTKLMKTNVITVAS